MSETPILIALFAAIFGAMASGGVQFFISWNSRKHQTEAVLTAIASEVDAICRLIQHQQYAQQAHALANDVKNGNWDGSFITIDIQANYFSVFEGLVSQMGYLKPEQATKIVNFYAYCKSIIDSTRPSGTKPSGDELAIGILAIEKQFIAIQNLGAEIRNFPRKQIEIEALEKKTSLPSP